MSKKKTHNSSFFIGKNIPKTDCGRKPTKGAPNSNLDSYEKKTGSFRSRRKFGSDGNVVKDLDVKDKKHPRDHVHDFPSGPSSRTKPGRKPTAKERREINKAKKKRRFWPW